MRKNNVMATTASGFEGYKILEYEDIVCCSFTVTGNTVEELTGIGDADDLISSAKMYVLKLARDKASAMGANALIGVNYELMTLGEDPLISLTATAVMIEPEIVS